MKLSSLAAAGLLCLSSAVSALDIHQLDLLALHSYKSATAFYNVTLKHGTPESQGALEERLLQLEQQVTATNQDIPEALTGVIAELNNTHQTFQTLARQNDIATEGFTNDYVIVDLNTALLKMAEQINIAREQLLTGNSESKKERLSRLARDMEALTTFYMVMASSLGDAFYRGTEHIDVGELVNQVRADFEAEVNLTDKNKDDPLMTAYKSWLFIEKTLHKYNERSAPHIVTRFNDRIVANLLDASAQTQ
ncbi:hypothetical protein [Parendozoicomonas haliclonae]|uniref:NarX-like N-terminal domain-containing protein n=1 Tax=Parendozoicomonas haliclonae TaxID=1960125 RepID=A0A1X7AKN0_9GAMM|nr:hypothetical protein [Parendozoicomonas haliclonae]SMA47240.1 hypothetical protein EHSB41UT_02350 [Parendozoicomonas haliclonae]